jgi:ribosomal 50S subunit-recycling heat shock protein
MRIDLFLKTAGLLKTRSIAGKAISSGAVKINGKAAKASTAVEEGSVVSLVRPDGETITLRVILVPETKNVSRKQRADLYEILESDKTNCF